MTTDEQVRILMNELQKGRPLTTAAATAVHCLNFGAFCPCRKSPVSSMAKRASLSPHFAQPPVKTSFADSPFPAVHDVSQPRRACRRDSRLGGHGNSDRQW